MTSTPNNGPMDFSDALVILKAGGRVYRAGWNGQGMWITMSPGNENLPAENLWSPHNRKWAEEHGGTVTVLPSITLKTAQNTIAMGWIPSTGDLFAHDWFQED